MPHSSDDSRRVTAVDVIHGVAVVCFGLCAAATAHYLWIDAFTDCDLAGYYPRPLCRNALGAAYLAGYFLFYAAPLYVVALCIPAMRRRWTMRVGVAVFVSALVLLLAGRQY